jgi:HSP20 family protein
MALRDMVPWRKQAVSSPADYVASFREQMDRLFNDFWSDFPGSALMPRLEERMGAFMPSVEVSEDKEKVKLAVELPGLSEDDVQLTLGASGEQLTIKGEKKLEEERKQGNLYRSERVYGAFQRVITLPARVDPEKVTATFKNGVLNVVMTKHPEVESGARRIRIGK